MSINPVPVILPSNEAQLPDAQLRPSARPASASASNDTTQPDSGHAPKQQLHSPQSEPATTELPADEVQVQRDTATAEIVIKYLDGSGNVILQVPSSQVLDVARAIDQSLEQEAKNATSQAAAESKGAKTYGH